ncbi:MAG: polyketide synthase, partial [Steroidobacteraceae bacterium]
MYKGTAEAPPGEYATVEAERPTDIAVIGIAARFPGARDLAQFWDNIVGGKSAVTTLPPERWTSEARARTSRDSARSAQFWGAFIEDVDCFDAAFFGISPREAASMDPQQRIALELAWAAIEDAGYRAADLAGSSTAVFMGVCHADYIEILEQQAASIDSY